MRNTLPAFSVIAASLLLTACVNGIDPSPMGRGYSSFKEPYKSAPGRAPRDIGYDYTEQNNEAVLKDMRYVAKDLVDKLDERLLFKAERLYLKPLPNTAFYNTFDHVLRAELVQSGYNLVRSPEEDALPVAFTAQKLDEVETAYEVSMEKAGNVKVNALGRENYEDMVLSLIVGPPKDEGSYIISGLYEVPMYGYRPQDDIPETVPEEDKSIPVDSYQR